MDLDATALRTMRAVAQAGSISGAARILGTSQPAVSQQVHRLERRLGTALLQRLGRGIRLTEAGHVLARHGGAVTAAIDAASEEIAALTGLRAGQVRLVAFPSSSATLVPSALALLRSRFPGMRVQLTEAEPAEALADLHAGRADIAVVFSYDRDDTGNELDQLAVRPLLDDRLWLVRPAGHPSAGSARLGDLREETWIAGCHRCRSHLLDLCRAAGFSPQIAYATDDYVAVVGLVAAGLGVAVLPELVLTMADRPDIQLTPLQPPSVRRIRAVTSPDLQRVPAVAAAINALAEVAAKSSPQRSSQMSVRGCEQQTSTRPAAGSSSGSGK